MRLVVVLLALQAACADPWSPQDALVRESRRVTELRGLPVDPMPELASLTRDEWIERVRVEVAQPPTETDQAFERLWQALRIVPPGTDSRRALAKVREGYQAYYDADRHQVVYFTDTPERRRDAAIFHALLHAAQHGGTPYYQVPYADGYLDDASWAGITAAEGEAVLFERAWPEANLAEPPSGLEAEFGEGPPFAVRWTYFAYLAGAKHLWNRGGGDLRRAAAETAARPPISTEQVLHPERVEDRPIAVFAPNLSGSLGDGWRRIVLTVLGEWTMADWVRALDPASAPAAGTAEYIGGGLPDPLRWGGDVAHVYRRSASEWRIVVWAVWDDEDSARRFEALAGPGAVRSGRTVRFSDGPVPEDPQGGPELVPYATVEELVSALEVRKPR